MHSTDIDKQAKVIEQAIEKRRGHGWTDDPKWLQLVAIRASMETAYQMAKFNELLATKGVVFPASIPTGRKFRSEIEDGKPDQ